MRPLPIRGLLLFALLVSAPGIAHAQRYYGPERASAGDGSINDWTIHSRTNDLSVMAWIPWYFGFGIGAELRYEIFVLPEGFIPTINDSFSIEPSIGIAYTSYGVTNYSWSITDIAPALYGIWSFYLSTPFRLYVGLGLGYNIGIATAPNGYVGSDIGDNFFYWDLVGGLSYKFTEAIAFRGELGSQGVKAGLSFYF